MCTLAVAFRADPRWPLVVAANRDERLGRPAETWALREAPPVPRYAAPRDLAARGHADPGAARGELVPLALASSTASAAREALAAIPADRYNPFHLVVADAGEAFLWRWDGERAGFDALAPGLHVVTEESPHGADPRGELVRGRWPLDLAAGRLRDLLAIHGPGRASSTCIHLDPVYGTRSSTILRLAPDLGASELYVADGAPCTAPFEDRSSLLAALARSA